MKEQRGRGRVSLGGRGWGWAGEPAVAELERKERVCGCALLPEAISKVNCSADFCIFWAEISPLKL